MAGVRNGKGSREGAEGLDPVERHRQSAARLLREGLAARAFGEMVRASRVLPMSPRLAAVLVAFSQVAGTEAAAIALLSSSLSSTRGDTRRAVRLQLARLLRRVGQKSRAIETLQSLVKEFPGDRRARRLLELLSGRAPSAPRPPRREGTPPGGFVVPPPPPAAGTPPIFSETLMFGATSWGEDEHTQENPAPPDARFSPRASSVDDRHGTPLETASPWARQEEEITSEASGLPFSTDAAPPSSPREDSDGAAFSHRRMTLDVTDDLPLDEDDAPSVPAAPPPAALRSGPPVPWGQDDETGPSIPRLQRREQPEDPRLEAQLIARQAWRELAQFYLARADSSQELSVRAEALTRLAELLENELHDGAEAARVYGQIVALTGDKSALAEQVRLLSQRSDGDDWAVRRVLDEAVQRASTPEARASAFLARGERLLSTGEGALARADFEACLALSPQSLPALIGLARCVSEPERPGAAERLRAVLTTMPRRAPLRSEGLRRLAELVSHPLGDARLAHWAWTEVLAENPGDAPAQEQLLELTRRLGDSEGLSRLLRASLAREPRGPVARKARLELVALQEAAGDRDAALAELRQAVRFEPGHKDAWLLLVERLIALGQNGEAAWALEHAATATEDDRERMGAWERLARFCRDVLGDAARAQVYANRADNLRASLAAPLPLPPEPTRTSSARLETTGARSPVLVPPPIAQADVSASAPTILEMPAVELPLPPAKPAASTSRGRSAVTPPPAASEPSAPPSSADAPPASAWDAPPGKMDPVRRRVKGAPEPLPLAPASPDVTVTRALATPLARSAPVSAEPRPAAIERVRERPLDPAAYRELSAFFQSRGDQARSALMAEVSSALAGNREATVRYPRRPLTPEERAGLRHPGLRNPSGELLVAVGSALCRLFPTFGRAAGSSEPLHPDSGPGARAALDALQSVARLLDVPLPDVYLSEDDGPPFSLVHPGGPRVLVGRLAVRQVLPEPELRFFAGRALFCVSSDLLALRCLRKDQLLRAVAILGSVLREGSDFGPESRVVRDALHPRARERALGLLESAQREFDAAALAEAARHSANRAGLVAGGGPGPALAALRQLKSSETECIELVRFSASERYLPLRALGA
ncbi:tetratricopeptide repeat protein [Cystobacter fuscus]|uniref:tetratricopeptide repeat protein n=1 Tax=Cystobacter fuscus TaxID=43 RepID=UPI002B2E8296|nr:tetratricopeptide repeat protein [Cystobacter fuscus]